jgi:sulfane dehydrogenase subunit SoxC
MNPKQSGRRRFLTQGPVLAAGLAVGSIPIMSARGQTPEDEPPQRSSKSRNAYGQRSRFEDFSLRRLGGHQTRDQGFRSPIQDQAGIVTPVALHYILMHNRTLEGLPNDPPDLDPKTHRLLIHGMVDRPLVLSLDDLKRLPSVTRFHFLECNANSNPTGVSGALRRAVTATAQDTHGLTSCSLWTGVPLHVLLEQAGVQKSATWIEAEGAEEEHHTKSIPMAKAMDDCLVVYGQNGEAVRPEQGYPMRLLVPGYEGINNVKWLRRIKLVDEPYMGMLESTTYPSLRPDGKARWFQFEMGPKSVITRPSGGQQLAGAGFYEISGLAWSGGGAIRRVEVSTDGGKTWKDAQLQDPVARKAHTRFVFPWEWNGEEAMIQSRSTDEPNMVQPTKEQIADLYHIGMDYYQTSMVSVNHYNGIQPWKISSSGSVSNAAFV